MIRQLGVFTHDLNKKLSRERGKENSITEARYSKVCEDVSRVHEMQVKTAQETGDVCRNLVQGIEGVNERQVASNQMMQECLFRLERYESRLVSIERRESSSSTQVPSRPMPPPVPYDLHVRPPEMRAISTINAMAQPHGGVDAKGVISGKKCVFRSSSGRAAGCAWV